VIDGDAGLGSLATAPAERATARSGRPSPIAVLAVGGGGCSIAGATLPWLTVYAGLDSYNGIAGTNGRLLVAGGAAAALAGLAYGIRPTAWARYAIGGLGFLLALLSAYVLAQLLAVYKQLHGTYAPALGPGVFLAAAGALVIFSTLFVRTEPHARGLGRAYEDGRASLAPMSASLVALSAAAGTIHLTVAADHFAEYFLFGLFFVVVGVALVAWAAAVAIAGSANRLLVLSAGNAVVVALWVASRTTGVPLGPSPGVPERVGYADLVTTIFEVLLVVLAVVALRSQRRGSAPTRCAALWSIPVLIAPATALAVLSAVGAIGFLPVSG
jgi:hypothetical protein